MVAGVNSAGEHAHVVFLGHGAERTGPPIMLGHLLGGLAEQTSWELSVLVARSGPMLAQYAEHAAPVLSVSATRQPFEPVAAVLRRVGLGRVGIGLQDHRRRMVAKRLPAADLVYVNAATPPTAALLRALAPDPSVPVLVHVHELDIGLRQNLTPEDRTFLFDRADHLIAASKPVADLLMTGHGLDPGRITTCDEFIDASAQHPLSPADARAEIGVPPGVPVVGSVGLPDWRKDPGHLLRAMADAPDVWVVWIGGSAASDDGVRLADEAARLDMTERFVHVEHHPEPSRILSAVDVFALPAREDAFPLAALEAAGIGLPLVCFRTGGVAGLCDDGAGTAVDYPDTAAFGSAIRELLEDDDLRAKVGAHGRQLALERHDLPVGTARIAAVISSMLDERHA